MQTARMRLSAKGLTLAAAMLLFCLWAVGFFTKCHEDNNFYREAPPGELDDLELRDLQSKVPWAHLNQLHQDPAQKGQLDYTEVECVVNDEYTVSCRKEGSEVYLPFSFLSKYFEIYGKLVEFDGSERFEWKHSYSRVYTPQGKYTPEGIFMSFEHYNVGIRDRVKCISGIEGVPISTQWGPQGYFYPIQIAQYGLSHYSKYLIDHSLSVTVLENGDSEDARKWTLADHLATNVVNIWLPTVKNRVIEFTAKDSLSSVGVSLPVSIKSNNFVLSFDFKFTSNGSVTVVLETKGKQPQIYSIHYVCSQELIQVEGNDIFYGIGDRSQWSTLTRDLDLDFFKGLALRGKKKKASKHSLQRIVSINFHGHGYVDNITLSSNAHLAQFYHAADWLVRHQDEHGGWPINVVRTLANGRLELPPGWYSAMAQGQAMSLLVRAYTRTNNPQYLDSALRATALFDIPSQQGGVLATFAGQYPWYEEYPTTPSCFVLNGFIYSLIGLYDLQQTVPDERGADASRLYSAGMKSLKALLPLYDTGSGSIYDLRHFTLGVAPNLARWDYHATHINQLLLLATIDDDPILESTAARWTSYMKGKRAPHN